ncbi:MAG: riboflavin synthase, partial [Cyclobacteriaceae bacterium]|nr:riboflavin synthase [Cyclobacteriaceae bacterium]
MFTGIVEGMGKIKEIRKEGSNYVFYMHADFIQELKVNQSLSHNGVCLTVTEVGGDFYTVTAVDETLKKSNLGDLKTGDPVNLERAMSTDYRFDGHIVQGHVDQAGICTGIVTLEGSWLFDFEYDQKATGNFLVEKGSVCINGVSLTASDGEEVKVRGTIIPHTWNVTNFQFIR